MAIPSGLSGQLGIKSESTFGTAVTVDTFIPIVSEGIKNNIARLVPQGIFAGRRTASRWKAGGSTIGGPITLELYNKPLAALMNHMFGAVDTTGTGPYVHEYTPGDLTGQSFTAQVGVPDEGGTVRAKTYAGCKVASWELACAIGEIPRLTLTVSAKTEVTDTALASASYLTGIEPFAFTEASLTVGGSPLARVRSMTLRGDNGLAVDRHGIGSASVAEQKENGLRQYGGTISSDFESLTAYNRFVNGTEAALVMLFDNGTDDLEITANVRFDGDTPNLTGPEMIEQPLPFVCTSNTDDPTAITAVLTNGESSAA